MPPKDNENIIRAAAEIASCTRFSVQEVAEAMAAMARVIPNVTQVTENLRQATKEINTQEQEENYLKMIKGTKARMRVGGNELWQCDKCHLWNHSFDHVCIHCGIFPETPKSTKIRVIRFLKKLGLKNA